MEKERLHYIDVAKGFLILLVVYGHIYGVSKNAGVDEDSVEWIRQSVNLFVTFYMPCFFVITGLCSSFKKPFFMTLTQSFKTIVLPGVFFTALLMVEKSNYDAILLLLKSIALLGGTYLFLSSLFLARIVYWIVFNKIEQKSTQNIVCVVVFLIVFFVDKLYYGPQPWYFVHALLLMPFFHIGLLLKNYELKQTGYSAFLFGGSFIATIMLSYKGFLQIDCFYHVPDISFKLLNMNLSMLLPFVLLSISGCLLCLGVSKRINSNRVLEYLGEISLVIYCLYIFVKSRLLLRIYNFGGDVIILKIVLAYLLTVIICSVAAYVLNFKYLRIFFRKILK